MARQVGFIFDVDGLGDFLNEAQRLHIPMAVATSARKVNRAFVLEVLNIASYFGAVVAVEDIQEGKPHPETFLTAAERLGAVRRTVWSSRVERPGSRWPRARA